MPQRGPKPRTARTARPKPPPPPDPRWEPPAHLKGEAAVGWRHVVGLLAQAGNLERTDPTLVELYAINFAVLRKAYATIEAEGVTRENRFQADVEHPSVATINSATMRLKAIINDLGLSPASSKFAATPHGTGGKNAASKWEGILPFIG